MRTGKANRVALVQVAADRTSQVPVLAVISSSQPLQITMVPSVDYVAEVKDQAVVAWEVRAARHENLEAPA